MSKQDSNLLAYAIRLHRHGITPLPTSTTGQKSPQIPWKKWTTTRPGPAELKEWFAPGNTDGIGMLTGTPSGGITMLEIEGRAIDLIDPIAERMDVRGLGDLWERIDTGWVERSPSGGIHWHYRTDRPRPNTKIARRPGHHPGVVDVLIETRGDLGFTILAPSNGRTHPTGVSWDLLRGGPGTIPTVTADEQDMLFAVLAEFDAIPVTDAPPAPPSRPTQPGAVGKRPGDDFSARVTWDEILTPHGWTRGRVMGHGHAWTRPDKRLRDGISATTGQAADGVDRLYVFSTSTEFEACRPYGKFAAWALLNGHGSDLAAAARDLASQGYGERRGKDTGASGCDGLAGRELPPPPGDGRKQRDDPGAQEIEEGAGEDERAAWSPIDLGPYLDGTHQPVVPTLLPRSDGACLLYPGLVHSFHGESESGKSLVLQLEAIRLVGSGADVLYVDFESDAGSVTERLVSFGADPTAIREHLWYVNPDVSPSATSGELQAWQEMLSHPYALVIIDGVTDSLGVFGMSTKDNDDIARWQRLLPKQIARQTGAAVAVIDHVVKDPEARGRFAIGGQAKMAGLTGAGYTVEIIQPLGRGLRGVISLRVGKDRPGHVRGQAGQFRKSDRTQEAARVIVDSTGESPAVTIEPPASTPDTAGEARPFRLTGMMEKVSLFLESCGGVGQSGKAVEDGIIGRSAHVRNALSTLIREGYVVTSNGPRGAVMHSLVGTYRQADDPQSDLYRPVDDPVDGGPRPPRPHLVPTSSRTRSVDLVPSPPSPTGGDEVRRSDRGAQEAPTSSPKNLRVVTRQVAGIAHRVNLDTGEILDQHELEGEE